MNTANIPLLVNEKHWECPSCNATDVTHQALPHTRMHDCAGFGGLTTPMIEAGSSAKHTANEREDYIGGDTVRLTEDGRPIMNIITTRDDGEDCTVFAPVATGSSR